MQIIDALRTWARESGVKEKHPQLHAMAGLAVGRPKHSIALKVLKMTGCTVAAGPFQGMKYVGEAKGSMHMPKLIGCYECELFPFLSDAITGSYDVIIDIGCAEGYYAVGMAMRLPQAHVYAFDTDENAQRLCRELAEVNGVQDRITVAGFCDPKLLDETITGKTLVICDCEGYEMELLDVSKAPSLKQADIIVEMHDCIDPKISSTMISRFRESHKITVVDSGTTRSEADFPVLSNFSKDFQQIATDEQRRGPMQWACMTANPTQD